MMQNPLRNVVLVAILIATPMYSQQPGLTRAEAALQIANDLKIEHGRDPKNLYGLFPNVFPGGYNGEEDISYFDREATVETVVVTIVRWAGWDTVHYDENVARKVAPYVTPEGFPFYSPDPTPRSIPYVTVALQENLISETALPDLRSAANPKTIDDLCRRAIKIKSTRHTIEPLTLDAAGIKRLAERETKPEQLLILPTGFSQYNLISGRPNRIIDLNSPNLRLFNSSASIANGKQDYFPLGPLETMLTVGLAVPANSYAHQSQAIQGLVENQSSTVNAVALWGAAQSQAKNARVWGGFISASSASGADKDAQIVGLEVDVINYALPGVMPNRSKTGIQIVGIGESPVTNGIELIGAGPAKWSNGLEIERGAIQEGGTVIGLADTGAIAKGINFASTRFTNCALCLGQNSMITLATNAGGPSAIYTDTFGYLVARSAPNGFRVTDNADSRNLLVVDSQGTVSTSKGAVPVQVAVPKTSSSSCRPPEFAVDENYEYRCVKENSWRRLALSAF